MAGGYSGPGSRPDAISASTLSDMCASLAEQSDTCMFQYPLLTTLDHVDVLLERRDKVTNDVEYLAT